MPPLLEKGREIRDPLSRFWEFFQIPDAFTRTRPWPCGVGHARIEICSITERPLRPPKACTSSASTAPQSASPSLRVWAVGVGQGGLLAAPALRRVLSRLVQGTRFLSPGPLPLQGAPPVMRERMAICTIAEASLGAIGPSKGPALGF